MIDHPIASVEVIHAVTPGEATKGTEEVNCAAPTSVPSPCCSRPPEDYSCPRCKTCLLCNHTQAGELPERFWLCKDGTLVWVNSDGTYLEF